ncbi:response regulator [Fuerstiella marisgermanici]|uniref:Response regulatory domain-containing protein n=1 Tax=Fuerstiella marisgermanici TaxID=1891926 RepID=A0A1P8WBW3_9PLAN|nr:response regulator [Fuerstiella marisgermanici]APZ91559.1 hypothetical protein Fuma_01148 [Fuerstiella marisgermanici]
MKVLIVEDADRKLEQLKDYVESIWPEVRIDECKSYASGLEAAIENRYELILLDMSLPNLCPSGKPA